MVTVDWNEVWAEKMRKNQDSYLNTHWSSRWNDEESATRYDHHATAMKAHFRDLAEGLSIRPTDHLLEIGPGTGSLTLPLSPMVERITVVEPSPYMTRILVRNLKKHRIQNVSIIRKRWEDIDPDQDLDGMYDLVLASHSLGMNDLRTALEKMNQVSSGYVYLFWFLGSSFLEQGYIRFWPSIHGREYSPLPKADIICKVLVQMGIHPECNPYDVEIRNTYSTLEAAITDYSGRFGVDTGDIPVSIREFIRENSFSRSDGIHVTGPSTNARIWWERAGLRSSPPG